MTKIDARFFRAVAEVRIDLRGDSNVVPKSPKNKAIKVHVSGPLLEKLEQKAAARRMNRNQYLRSLIIADCERKAPVSAGDLNDLRQVAEALTELSDSQAIAEMHSLIKRYIKASAASWKS